MTPTRLSRHAGDGRPEAPIRLLHLGLGSFFRAHQAWYTERSNDAEGWGIAAFTGRSPDLASALRNQDGLYTLVTRAPAADRYEVISSLCRAHDPADWPAWLGYFADSNLAAVTVTITEAGYHRDGAGNLDLADPAIVADVEHLRLDHRASVRSGPAKLVAGLAARRQAGGAPLAVIPCDNVPDNGDMARRVIAQMAGAIDPGLSDWIAGAVAVVATVVDRITPRAEPDERRLVAAHTGRDDAAPVVTEPFSEWILSGRFPQGRPSWESAGAEFTGDIRPFERRKLWLLNGAHSLLAYAGSVLGHRTVGQAIEDPRCLEWVRLWWGEAAPHLHQDPEPVAGYQEQLLARFSNPRMNDRLSRIAEDGSQKLPIRVVPVIRAEREAGRLPRGAATTVAGWVCHLRGLGAAVRDVRADEAVRLAGGSESQAVHRILTMLDPALGDDPELACAVEERVRMLVAGSRA